MSTLEQALVSQIAKKLSKAGFEFAQQPAVGGLRPDFVVTSPAGKTAIVEVKGWAPAAGNVARASTQAVHYKEATGADGAFVVLPDLKKNFVNKGVVDPDSIIYAIEEFFEAAPAEETEIKLQKTERTVFAAMPFDKIYDDTFFVAMRYAAEKATASCVRADLKEFTGDVVTEMKTLIEKSDAVVADLSEGKPNVLYEVGYAHALRKPTIHICATATDKLPFDVRNWNTLLYTLGQTTQLRDPPTRRLQAALK